jgi:hypothetical protein
MTLVYSCEGANMTNAEYQKRLHELICTCEMNQLYHQRLEWRYVVADRLLKIAVGILAVVGAVLAMPETTTAGPPTVWACIGFVAACLSAAFAVALNVIPVGDTAKTHGEMFRLWSDLLKDALQEEHKTCEAEADGAVRKAHDDRLCELIAKKETLNASETAAWPKLLLRCQGDVNERRWGEGIRTAEEVETERSRRESQVREATTSAC